MFQWYVHDFQNDTPILGPLDNFVLADRQARKQSEENSSGLAEVRVDSETVTVYVRGKLRYRGLRARQARNHSLPPTL